MANLSVQYGGVEFRNPLWLASLSPCAPFTSRKDAVDIVMKSVHTCYKEGMGGYVTGSIFDIEADYEWKGKARNMVVQTRGFADRETMVGIGTMPDGAFPRSMGLDLIKRIRKECPEMPVIASLYSHGVDAKGWARLAEDAKSAGASMVELNVCCFMVFDQVEGAEDVINREDYSSGLMLGLVPELTTKLISNMKKLTDMPIIVKIPPELPMLRLIPAAGLYQQAGATGVTCSHVFMTAPPPDIYNQGRPSMPFMDKVSFFGFNGPALRFGGCNRNVAAIAKNYTPGLEVSACGGLVIPEHIIEAMMLGARTAQLSSGIMFGGYSFISQTLNFMSKFMEDEGYNKVDDFIGLGLEHILDHPTFLKWWNEHPVVAKVDYDKCNKCGICMDNFCFASYWKDGWPKIDGSICGGCNLCVIRCPVGARSLVPLKKDGKMPEWEKPVAKSKK
jgi:dihydropyrimidine dehydrogenase (NAD+) subunit PreA